MRLSWFPVKGNTRLGRGCRRPHATSPNPHLKKTKPHTSRGLTEPGPILNDRIDLPLIPYPDTRCWILLAGRRPYASGSTCTASHLHGLWWPAFSSRRWFRQQADGHELSKYSDIYIPCPLLCINARRSKLSLPLRKYTRNFTLTTRHLLVFQFLSFCGH